MFFTSNMHSYFLNSWHLLHCSSKMKIKALRSGSFLQSWTFWLQSSGATLTFFIITIKEHTMIVGLRMPAQRLHLQGSWLIGLSFSTSGTNSSLLFSWWSSTNNSKETSNSPLTCKREERGVWNYKRTVIKFLLGLWPTGMKKFCKHKMIVSTPWPI